MKPHLPDPGRKSRMPRQVFTRQRRGGAPWREGGIALLNGAAGLGVLVLLLQLPSRLDSLLLGVLQALALLLLLGLAVGALLLLVHGVYRLLRLAMPGLGGLLALPAGLARLVWSVVRIRPPDRPER